MRKVVVAIVAALAVLSIVAVVVDPGNDVGERNASGALETTLSPADCVGFDLPHAEGEVNSVVDPDSGVMTLTVLDPDLAEDRSFTFPFGAPECAENPSLRQEIAHVLQTACPPPMLVPAYLPPGAVEQPHSTAC